MQKRLCHRASLCRFQSDSRKRRLYITYSFLVLWIPCLFQLETHVAGFPVRPRTLSLHQIRWRSRIRYQATLGEGERSESGTSTSSENSAETSSTGQQQPARSGGWVDADQLNQLKEQVDIISLVESYDLPQFQRRGDNRAVALCPFHEDNNPSLNIDGNRRLYKCFACGAGGDVFRFVKEYNRVLNGEELSFYQAVRHVNRYFTDGTILDNNDGSSSYSKRLSEDERKELEEKKDRIYSMNEAAATFYLENLALPFAGGARSYLQQRGFQSPDVARAFAVGYAPDVYYGKMRGASAREQMSLVTHLKDLGFKPDEMVEAGLAVRTKRAESGISVRSKSDANKTSVEASQEVNENECSSLMDRFRGRLVVPILDATGNHVVAFGGRILPFAEDENSDFKAPKYLNSPETLVFQKKNILFGNHMAVDHYQRMKVATRRSSAKRNENEASQRPLILVEGYMDVLALWDAGIRTAVASMGTGLTLEQLKLAAKTANTHNDGKVVLCLDNDDAGIAAVERLCTGGILAGASNGAQFLVASLPDGVKDPGEFIEIHKGNGATEFQKEVVDKARDWSDWMLSHIVSRYNKNAARGAPGSFGDLFSRVSEFLAMSFSNAAERTQSAYRVAGVLASIMANDANATSISNAARMQLESDLIDAASRIASAKDAMNRRVESITGGSPAESRKLLSAMSRGTAVQDDGIDREKLSSKALRETSGDANADVSSRAIEQEGDFQRKFSAKPQGRTDDFPRRRTFRPVKKQGRPAPLTPHFSGFHFENESDADWLGIPREEWKRDKGSLILGAVQLENKKFEKIRPVYFNSNEYHGRRFISSDALRAGYNDKKITKKDIKSIVEKGVASMLIPDIDQRLQYTEDALLRTLAMNYPQAGSAVKSIMDASAFVGPSPNIEWTRSDKRWLFTCLVDDKLEHSANAGVRCDPVKLRAILSKRADAPADAFGESDEESLAAMNDRDSELSQSDDFTDNNTGHLASNETQQRKDSRKGSNGTLNQYFEAHELVLDQATMFLSASSNSSGTSSDDKKAEVAELAAQEQLMALATASAAKQVQNIQVELKAVSGALISRSEALSGTETIGAASVESGLTTNGIASAKTIDLTSSSLDAPSDSKTMSAITVSVDDTGRNIAALQLSSQNNMSSFAVLSVQDPSDGSSLAVGPDKSNGAALTVYDAMNNEELTVYCKELMTELQQAMERRQSLEATTRRVTLRLMRFSSARVEGRLSTSLQRDIATNLDAFTKQVINRESNPAPESEAAEDNSKATTSMQGEFSSGGAFERRGGGDDEEPSVEEELAEMEADWGEWFADDFEWTPEQAGQHNAKKEVPQFRNTVKETVEENDETLEEALARIDEEWGEWSD